MPRKRKKAAKSTARKKQPSKKATRTNTTGSALLKLERALYDAPTNLTNQLTKEIAALKQRELKIKAALSKIESQINKLDKSIAAAEKSNTATSRKRLRAAKKSMNDTKKDQVFTNKLLKETSTEREHLELGLAKISAMRKALQLFEKDWKAHAKKLKDKKIAAEKVAAAKKKAASLRKSKAAAKTKVKAKPAAEHQAPALTIVEPQQADSFESLTDDLKEIIQEEKQAAS